MSLINNNDLMDTSLGLARVPVCLCLDTSGSMDRIIRGETKATGQTVYRDGKEWNVVTGGVSAINDLTAGVKTFLDELRSDEISTYSAEICIVTFGAGGVKLVRDFANLNTLDEVPTFRADGETPMGEAINLALDRLEEKKKEYQNAGIDYFQPWLVLMTDGEPNGSTAELERAIRRTSSMVLEKKLTVFPVGIGDEAGMGVLTKLSPKNGPLKIQGTKFKEFFQWLSQSVNRTSQSMPGETIPLDVAGIKGWAELG